MYKAPPLHGFILRIAEICRKDTSSDPEGWKADNPLWGHCAIVSVLAQEIYGGEIWRASLVHVPHFMHLRSHYGNRLPGGAMLDFTAGQFGSEYPPFLEPRPSSRDYILGTPSTAARYELLKSRVTPFSFRISLREGHQDDKRQPVPRKKK